MIEVAGAPRSMTRLLRRMPGLATLTRSEARVLAASASARRVPAGAVAIREGATDDELLVLLRGTGVLTAGDGAERPLAMLAAGDVVGELAGRLGRRTATLTATSELSLLAVPRTAYERALRADTSRIERYDEHVREIVLARFIRRIAVFAALDDQGRRWLARRVRERHVRAGHVLVREGASDTSCFLLRSGAAEVRSRSDGGRALATLGPGAIFGEGAVLTSGPRMATVIATAESEVFELAGEDLRHAVDRNPAVARELVYLFRLRRRPQRDPAVEVHDETDAEGRSITTLKHPGRIAYYRLSERGRFVWDRLDGDRTLRQLSLDYFERFGVFEPYAVAGIVGGLASAGMLDIAPARVKARARGAWRALELIARVARRLLLWVVELRGVDRPLAALYRLVRPLYGARALALLSLLALAGAVAFALGALDHGRPLRDGSAALLLPIGVVLGLIVHEAGHALTVKHFGREVPRAGIGWYWFRPLVFVDVSDMWLATRRGRIGVNLAGVAASLLLGAVLSIAALAVAGDAIGAALWSLAVPCYVGAVVNLCPAMELDGYHVLSDAVNRPNLRSEALHRLARRELRGRRLDLAYVAGCLLWMGLMTASVLLLLRPLLEGWSDELVPGAAATLAWALAAAQVALVLVLVADDLRRAANPPA